jgi:hypothetical protein
MEAVNEYSAQHFLLSALATLNERGVMRDNGSERSMARAVNTFNALVGGDRRLSELDGWMFMCVLKMARSVGGVMNPDDFVDLAGYAALAGESAAIEEERGECCNGP